MQIANLAKRLEATGLTEKQARVYVASLFLGAAAVQRIAEQAEVNRATTYVILAELAEMGLVSETVQGKKTVYVAEPPEAIERYLSSMERVVADRKAQLKGVMTDLHDINRAEIEDAPVVRFYKGAEAAEAVNSYLHRKTKKNSMVYAMSDIDEVLKIYPDALTKNPEYRKKKAITSRLFYSGSISLGDDTDTGREVIKLKDKVRGDMNIYEDRMTILSYSRKDSVGVIIESKEIVAVMRQLFELAWDKYKK